MQPTIPIEDTPKALNKAYELLNQLTIRGSESEIHAQTKGILKLVIAALGTCSVEKKEVPVATVEETSTPAA